MLVSTAQSTQVLEDIPAPEKRWLRRRVLTWFDKHGRDFPWRSQPEPYSVLIAELLLQRTRADLVLRVYESFLARYPDAAALAAADPDDIISFLRPLGFTHRSKRIPHLGRELCEAHGGEVPQSKEALLALTGVGEYVANAVLAIAFAERRPLLDPNVIRLVSRLTGRHSERSRPRDDRQLWALIESLLPRKRATAFGLALVDLGATICRVRRPRCWQCPLRSRCVAFASGAVAPADEADSWRPTTQDLE
jgi:A/G-specific adenine glycosylase